jgi:hypothetical protein
MPEPIRFYIRNVLIGFAVAAVFVAALLWFNVANLTHLIFTSDIWAVALFMLWFFNGIVFAGVQSGIAVMAMARDSGEDGPGGNLPVRAEPVMIPAVAPAPSGSRKRFVPLRRDRI